MENLSSIDQKLHVQDEHTQRRLKVIQRTSASQIGTAERCLRKWFFSEVEGLRPPSTPAQLRGTDFDDNYVQNYLKTGQIKQGPWTDLLKETIPFLPEKPFGIQYKLELPTYEGGPQMIGYADILDISGRPIPGGRNLQIDDLKTTSNFQYCKSDEQLRNDIQMVTYAQWGYQVFKAKQVAVNHIYARTTGAPRAHRSTQPHSYSSDDGACTCLTCKEWRSAVNRGFAVSSPPIMMSLTLTRNNYEKRFPLIKQMVATARTEISGENVTPNPEACNDFGGCPFRGRCGFTNGIKSLFGGKKMVENGNGKKTISLAEKLRIARENAQGAVPKVAVAQPAAEEAEESEAVVAKGFLPPDAPSRESTQEETDALIATAKKRGRPKKVEAAPAAAPVGCGAPGCGVGAAPGYKKGSTPGGFLLCMACNSPAEPEVVVVQKQASKELQKELEKHPAPTERKVPATAPIIFVDCLPSKGAKDAIDLNEWLAPIAEIAARANDVEDVRLISYTSKGVLATAIRACLDTTPKTLLIDSRQFGADVALEVLTPFAQLIVRGIR